MNINIYNNLSKEQLNTFKKLNIEISMGDYSKKDYECLCTNLANYYHPINKLAETNISLDEYCLLIEKIYEFKKLYK